MDSVAPQQTDDCLHQASKEHGSEKAPQEESVANNEPLVGEVADNILMNDNHFSTEVTSISTSPPGRMQRIIREIDCLKTSLPPGIFVRHGSTRLDMMKVLIIGPRDTPYENGIFEFDLFCTEHFPQKPPQMMFRTSGCGGAEFNPNLYNDGTVCLSLLNTWLGPHWEQTSSTLLQLLVSIQAMVFSDEPLTNEPGCEGWKGSKESLAYNRRVYALTIRHALLPWLRKVMNSMPMTRSEEIPDPASMNSEAPTSEAPNSHIWERVILNHFASCEKDLANTVRKWVEDVQGSRGDSNDVLPEYDGDGPDALEAHLSKALAILR